MSVRERLTASPRRSSLPLLLAGLTVGVQLAGAPAAGPTEPPSGAALHDVATASSTVAPQTVWPTAASTGVVAGTRLRRTGSVTVTRPGTVLQGLDIRGCVSIRASRVTIRNSRITCAAGSGNVVTLARGLTAVLLDRIEVNGLRNSAICVAHGGYVLRAGNLHDCVDGARAGSNTTIEQSYVHHLTRMPGSHNDAVQTVMGSNIVVRGNRLLAYNPDTRDLMNAAYLFGPSLGPVSRVTVRGNYLDGGNFTLSGTGSSVTVTDNTFGPRHRYGALRLRGSVIATGNRVEAGAAVLP